MTEYKERDDAELLDEARSCLRRARVHLADWRSQAREDYAFVASDQWTEEDTQLLKDQGRPVITFNRIAPIIDAVCGSEVSNRQETTYIPRELGDVAPNEILSGAAKWARDLCNAEDEESDSFRDATICGLGWTETRMDYETDPEGLIYIERVDPMEVYYDPAAKKSNLVDARWVMRLQRMDRAVVEERWPDKADLIAEEPDKWADLDEMDSNSPQDIDPQTRYENKQTKEGDKDQITVADYQWYERSYVWRVADPMTRQVTTLEDDEYKVLQKRFGKFGMKLQGVKLPKRRYCRAFFAGNVVLEQKEAPCPDGFSYRAITGKRDRNTNTWYGLVRAMKDPQRWANKWLAQVLHVINSNAKGGVIVEKDAVESASKFEEAWPRTDAVVWVKSGGVAKVLPRQAITYPSGLDKLMEFAIASIRDVSGVNLELLGMADREQAGVLEYQRKQAGLTILAGLFDSLRRYRKDQGRMMIHFIREYISDGRLIRILSQGQQQYIPLIRDPQVAEYDVVVDDAPTSPNQKEKTFGVMSQLMPALLKAGIPVPPEILDYAPLPQSLIEAWKKLLQGQTGANPEQMALMQQQMQALQENIQKLEQENQQLKLKKQEKLTQLALQRDLSAGELALRQNQIEHEHALDLAKANMDFGLKIKQHQMDAVEMANKMALETRKQIANEDIQRQKVKSQANRAA